MSSFQEKIDYLKSELEQITHAYNVINSEHSMMLKELGLSNEVKPTKELVRNAIKEKCVLVATGETEEKK
jgi:hypothetical protein